MSFQKKHIIRICKAALLACFALAPFSVFSQSYRSDSSTNKGDLWEVAVAVAEKNRTLMAGSVYSYFERRNMRGKLKDQSETWYKISLGTDNILSTFVKRSVKNGKDNTEDARKQNQNRSGIGIDFASFLPFLPKDQSKITVNQLDATKTIKNRLCIGFYYQLQKGENESDVGTAWLDKQTGVPWMLEYRPDPLPNMVKELTNKIYFTLTQYGDWAAERITFEGVGGFLFVRQTFRVEIELSDYFHR